MSHSSRSVIVLFGFIFKSPCSRYYIPCDEMQQLQLSAKKKRKSHKKINNLDFIEMIYSLLLTLVGNYQMQKESPYFLGYALGALNAVLTFPRFASLLSFWLQLRAEKSLERNSSTAHLKLSACSERTG